MAPIEKSWKLTAQRALFAFALAALACPAQPARSGGHGAADASVTAIAGEPGAFDVRTAAGHTTARWPTASPAGPAPDYVIRALDHDWDFLASATNGADTLAVPTGSTVRWQLVSGIHTLTSGRGADDPDAGAGFDYLLDELHPQFDSTFTSPDTVDYFCFFHEPHMRGTLIVVGNAGVPGERIPSRLAFTQPPSPNPSRGVVSFDIGLPREQKVRVEVLDLLGARVALLHDGPLGPGEHPFRWRGLTDRGERANAGVYTVMLRSGAMKVSRTVSLLR
jgi:flagellar hook capping protein FlgD